jgi:hypothetical protein
MPMIPARCLTGVAVAGAIAVLVATAAAILGPPVVGGPLINPRPRAIIAITPIGLR